MGNNEPKSAESQSPTDGIVDHEMYEQNRQRRLRDARASEDEWLEWYRMTPMERWQETSKLWQYYLQIGGTLDPEPDSQSPFDPDRPPSTPPAYGGAGVRVIRRGGV